jgi:lysophospholipase L1-like esterase
MGRQAAGDGVAENWPGLTVKITPHRNIARDRNAEGRGYCSAIGTARNGKVEEKAAQLQYFHVLDSRSFIVIHLRARSGLHASSSLLFLCLLAGPDCRTRAEEVTGNIVFAGDSLTAGTGAGPRGSFPAQTLAILGRGWKGHNSGTSGRWARQALEDYDASIGRYFDSSSPRNVLVLWEAGDELVSGSTPEEVADTLARIVGRARATGFDRIVLVTSTPRSNFPEPCAIPGTAAKRRHTFDERCDVLDARVLALYPKVDAVVSLQSDGQVGVDAAETNPVYFAGDRIHMNDRGYFVVAARVAERIQAFGPRRLLPGQSWTSPQGHYHLILQSDGNLVLYGPRLWALWASDTQGQPAAEAVFEPAGNLVVYGPQRQVLWSSHSEGHTGADLRVQDDGNVVIYHKQSAIWSTGTGIATRARKGPPPVPAALWKEHWTGHDQLLKLVAHNDDVAIYFDRDMPLEDARWLFTITTRVWKYTKKTYGDFGFPDDRLFAIFHKGRGNGGRVSSYFASDREHRNAVDIGLHKWDYSQDGYVFHEIGHIVEGASNGVHGSPAFGHHIWGDSKWAEFFQYDVRFGIGQVGETREAFRRYTETVDKYPRPNSHWFRDFFYPAWRDYGHAQVMVNYFRLLSKHYPREAEEGGIGLKFARDAMNWGEFIHFMSGAAAKDLRPLANQAFGWPAEWETQFQKARAEFPGVLYPE